MFRFLRRHKTLFISLGFLTLFSVTISYATPPTSPYNAGQTLDPNCAPGNNNCTVTVSSWTVTSNDIYYNTGKVGIGTISPVATFDIEGDGAILAAGAFGSGITVPTLMNGTRLMWIPSKGVFRATGYDVLRTENVANVGSYSVAFGYGSLAAGAYSFASGHEASASNDNATAFGDRAIASGNGSFAAGTLDTASGDDSVAFGFATSATGSGSAAFGGGYSTASGASSVAFGGSTNASGGGAASFGSSTVAAGSNATAFGDTTTARSLDSVATGRFNVGGGAISTWVGTDPVFEIGNGADSAHLSNAITVLKNGNVGIAIATPTVLLSVGSSSAASGNVAHFETSAAHCDLDPTTTGGLTCSSDMNLKTNVANLSDSSPWNFNTNITVTNQSVLAKVLALQPVQYNWNTEQQGTTKHDGFIAQDIRQVFPELVSIDSKGSQSLNYTGLIPYTVEAIKEMNVNIMNINDMTTNNSWREAIISWFANTANGIGDFVANRLRAKNEVCINDTCINENQLKQILQSASAGNFGSGATQQETIVTSDQSQPQSPDVVPVNPPENPTEETQSPEVPNLTITQ